MAKIELREISERLGVAGSRDSVISSLLKYLQQLHRDWCGAVALYECSTDRLVSSKGSICDTVWRTIQAG